MKIKCQSCNFRWSYKPGKSSPECPSCGVKAKEYKALFNIDEELLQYKCAIYPETFSGKFKYTVFRYGRNGMSAWFNEDIGFVSKTTVYINRDRSWYDSRQEAYDAAIKWLKK